MTDMTPEVARELLKRYGFDHVPAAEELQEILPRRRAEVREEVLFQADLRNWCEDGTRAVCANLRVARPGDQKYRRVTYQVTMDVEIVQSTWTERGALARALAHGGIPTEGSSPYSIPAYSGGVRNVVITNLTVDGTTYELTDDLRKELTDEQ